MLAFISDIDSDIDQQFTLGAWWWAAPLALIGWGCVVFVARGMPAYESDDKVSNVFFSNATDWFMDYFNTVYMTVGKSPYTWGYLPARNYLPIAYLLLYPASFLFEYDIEDVYTSYDARYYPFPSIIFLLIMVVWVGLLLYVLYRASLRSESSRLLLVLSVLFSCIMLLSHLGARPSQPCSAQRYYEALERDSLATPAVADYRLSGCLVDRRLDEFVALLPRYYQVADSLPLPRHYQEALVLYRHLRTNPALVYHHPVVDEDWDNLKQLEAQYPLPTERHFRVFDRYRGSYWYYYFYEK